MTTHKKEVGGQLNFSGNLPRIMLSSHWAQNWYEDALNEVEAAKADRDINFVRREIIFAVCFAESYLLEWARDSVFKGNTDEKTMLIKEYFRKRNESLTERWKRIVKEICSKVLKVSSLNFGESYWDEWLKLVDFRHGFSHGRESIPYGTDPPDKNFYHMTSPGEAAGLKVGWATRTVFNLIYKLHEVTDRATGTKPPSWLRQPEIKK
jgi:hypothetical protein